MSNAKMANIAKMVPTTIEELSDCELPQNVQKQYGERLVTSINSFIEQSNLQQYIDNRPKKKQKTVVEESNAESKPILIDVPDSDEFGDDDDDYFAVQMPDTFKPSALTSGNPNPYSQKPAAKPAAKTGSKLKTRKSASKYFG